MKIDQLRDHGIEVNPSGGDQQKVLCPECTPLRKKKHLKDLSVNVAEGTWYCHHCSWSGGIKPSQPRYTKPEYEELPLKPGVLKYLTETRKITEDVLKRNQISNTERFMGGQNKIVVAFPYFKKGKRVNAKYRSQEKEFAQESGAEKILYKLDDVTGKKEIIITEGEIDALSFEVAGYENSCSIPDGAINPGAKNISTKMEFLDNSIDFIGDAEKYYLAMDNDGPGLAMREEIARRLGKEKCWIINYPEGCKDANDVLCRFSPSVLHDLPKKAQPYPLKGVVSVEGISGDIDEMFTFGLPDGIRATGTNLDHSIRFIGSQLTIITGIPGHGKSALLNWLLVNLSVRHGWKTAMYSPESWPLKILFKDLAEVYTGKSWEDKYKPNMNQDDLRVAKQFIGENFFFIRPDDVSFSVDNIVDVAKLLVTRRGINALVIDPWNKLEHLWEKGDNETNHISRELDKLTLFAQLYGVHIFLVAHPRKMGKKKDSMAYMVPTLYDINGSANFFNKAFNGISVYRNYEEQEIDEATQKKMNIVEVHIQKVKQKHLGETGLVELQFSPLNNRYCDKHGTFDYKIMSKPESDPVPMWNETDRDEEIKTLLN